MAPRVRPATTLCVILAIAFAFQLIATLSVPVTSSIYLSQYQGYKFGVFGLCHEKTCSSIDIGYRVNDIQDLEGFSLPSNARHSVSKLLIVHPVSAGFTLVLLLGSLFLHWHGPSSSSRYLFFLLLWTLPTFLLSLLSFLVDILLFIPHLSWGGWIVLASTVLTAISGVLFCIMRRTVSSRKSAKKLGRSNTFNEYQMAPLNYGIGTVDGGSASKVTSADADEGDEHAPFVHEGNTTYDFDNTLQNTETKDLNEYQQTELYNSMRNENNNSQRSRYTDNVLAPLQSTYRGYSDYNTNDNTNVYRSPKGQVFGTAIPGQDTVGYSTAPDVTSPLLGDNVESAPYPTDIPQGEMTDLPSGQIKSQAPYPTSEYASSATNLLATSPLKPQGPRPMSNSTTDFNALEDSNTPYPRKLVSDTDEEPEFGFESPVVDLKPPSVIGEPQVSRKPTYRTAIENKINALQSVVASDSAESLSSLKGHSSGMQQSESGLVNELDFESTYDETTNDMTTLDETSEILNDDAHRESSSVPTSSHNVTSNTVINTAALINPGIPIPGDESSDYTAAGNFTKSSQTAQHSYILHPEPDELSYNDIYKPSQPNAGEIPPIQENLEVPIDAASSAYSSIVPSRIPSVSGTPVNDQFPRDVHRQFGAIPEDSAIVNTASSEYIGVDYPFPDPMDRRTTPAPSFSNESMLSSTFTSVSQREINPKYLEKHDPAQYNLYLQRQVQNRTSGQIPISGQSQEQQSRAQRQIRTVDMLIDSNPDFAIGFKQRGKR